MKFFILLGLGLAMSAASVRAQDTARIQVRYKFSHVRDTNNRANPYRENMVLLVGKYASVYKSRDRRMEEVASPQPDGTVRTDRRGFGSRVEYYQNLKEKKMDRVDWLPMTDFLISDVLPAISWKISTDTASFGGLRCQKATGHFRGRDYIVWFCPDLPLHAGPWKLNGLPGVIVEAYDSKNDVRFSCDGIEKIDPTVIQAPGNGVKITDKEFARLQETLRKDPDAFSRSMAAMQGGDVAGGRGPKMDIKFGPGPVMNNPIELPEKQ